MKMKKGDVYLIRNCTVSGQPIIEGRARLVKRVGGSIFGGTSEVWMVEFVAGGTIASPGREDNQQYRRTVYANDRQES